MHWHRLLSKVVDAPSLETLKVRLDGALSNLIYLWVTVHCREVELDDLKRSLPTQTIL